MIYSCMYHSLPAGAICSVRGPRKFCQRGSSSDIFFLFRGTLIPLKAGHDRPASERRFAGWPMMVKHR